MGRRKLVAGNWKMHGTSADLAEVTAISIAAETAKADMALCLPATLMEGAVRAAPGFAIGGQDVHQADKVPIPDASPRRCCSTRAPD